MPEVRRAVPHRARDQGPPGPHVPPRGLRLSAGGRDHRRMRQPVAAFLRHLEVEKQASPHTIRAYRRDLEQWVRFMLEPGGPDMAPQPPQRALAEATARDVRAWLAALHARGLGAVSVARKLAAVRSFYRFLVRRGV